MPIDPDFAREFFIDRVDVYAPGGFRVNDDGMDEDAGLELYASDVPCMMDPKSEGSTSTPIGRMNRDILITSDVFYFSDDGPPIEDGWVFRLKTPNHPENGTWFVPVGGRQPWTQIAGAVSVLTTRGLNPAIKAP